MRPSVKVGDLDVNWFYYLTDGLYPRFRIFVQTIAAARNKKEKKFSVHQEGARKSVERVFGVLFSRFHILCKPSRLWQKEDMNYIVKACCIIHNMICEERKDQYSGTTNIRIESEEDRMPIEVSLVTDSSCTYEQAAIWRCDVDKIEDEDEYFELQRNLVQHIWNISGKETTEE